MVELFCDMFVILHFFQGYEFELQLLCIEIYCSISFNSACSVTCYQLAEISISAGPRFECGIYIFPAGRGVNFVLEACKLSIVN